MAHVRAKLRTFQSADQNAGGFIRLAGTSSLLTGKPYLVRTRDGKEMPLNAWLTDALENIASMTAIDLHRSHTPSVFSAKARCQNSLGHRPRTVVGSSNRAL